MAKRGRKRKVNPARLLDKQAKDILIKWPKRTNTIWVTPKKTGYWVQARPNINGIAPTLILPGAEHFQSQPDGLWVYFHNTNFVDIICVEVCNSISNLNDKRLRYVPTSSTILLRCPTPWFTGMVNLEKSGRKNKRTRWEACGTIQHIDENNVEYKFPIRSIRVLLALQDKLYTKFSSQIIPMAHEYICSHTSLKSISSRTFKEFLGQLSISKHSYTKSSKKK